MFIFGGYIKLTTANVNKMNAAKLMTYMWLLDYVVNLAHFTTMEVLNIFEYGNDDMINIYCLGALFLTIPLIGLILGHIVLSDQQKIKMIFGESFEISCDMIAVCVVTIDLMFVYSYVLLVVDMSYWYIIFESIVIVVNVFANVEIIGY